jgi:uncharacterized protein
MIEQQETIIKLLTALFPQVKVYLFGSRARGNFKASSDIDIGIDAGYKLSFLDLAKARNVLEALYIPQKIDLVDMRSIPEEMYKVILSEGIAWKT